MNQHYRAGAYLCFAIAALLALNLITHAESLDAKTASSVTAVALALLAVGSLAYTKAGKKARVGYEEWAELRKTWLNRERKFPSIGPAIGGSIEAIFILIGCAIAVVLSLGLLFIAVKLVKAMWYA